jgi:hypothetical protein
LKRLLQQSNFDPHGKRRLSKCSEQNQAQLSIDILLVDRHMGQKIIHAKRRWGANREFRSFQNGNDPSNVNGIEISKTFGEICRLTGSDRHGFTMENGAISKTRFYGVTKGVAEVQRSSLTGFSLIP